MYIEVSLGRDYLFEGNGRESTAIWSEMEHDWAVWRDGELGEGGWYLERWIVRRGVSVKKR